MVDTQDVDYLSSLLGMQLRVHTTDDRMFVGEFRCTDNESNVILARTQEYRLPARSAVQNAITEHDSISSDADTVKLDMTSRFLGLVVVPGEFITKIEMEFYEDAKQSRGAI